MHTDTLKELLKIYSKLPTGLIVFKNRRIYFINDHLRDVLSLGTIPPDEALAMIGGILEEPATDKSIYTFFEEHDFFTYKNKYIQIISRSEKPYHIFVFALLEPELLDKLSQMDASRRRIEPIADDDITHEYLIDADEHKNLLQHFDSRRNSKARGYVLYRGVPLIADVIAVQPLKGTLAVRAGDKQMVSATTGTPWILSFASGKTILGEAVHANP
ncbi:MAG: hypothetical protein R3302_06540 [Sulfurimonadaceae bacterium]|nr:hypothetical protein [Sulfurimonadaceae bacterium]